MTDHHVSLSQYIDDARSGSLTGFGIDLRGWRNPYTRIKSDFYCVLSYPLLLLCIRLKVKPNLVTIIYAFSSIAAAILVLPDSRSLTAVALSIMFLNGALDWLDGQLARVTGQTSALGHSLDEVAGVIKQLSFVAMIGIIVAQESNSSAWLVLTIVTVLNFMSMILVGQTLARTQIPDATQGPSDVGMIRSLVLYDGRARYTDIIVALVIGTYFGLAWYVIAVVVIMWSLASAAGLARAAVRAVR